MRGGGAVVSRHWSVWDQERGEVFHKAFLRLPDPERQVCQEVQRSARVLRGGGAALDTRCGLVDK